MQGSVFDTAFPFDRGDLFLRAADRLRGESQQHLHARRDIGLAVIQRRQKDTLFLFDSVKDQGVILDHLFERGFARGRVDLQKARGRSDQLILRQTGVTIETVMLEDERQSRPHADARVLRGILRQGDHIGGLKGDSDPLLA